MSYENPVTLNYCYGGVDYGNGTVTRTVRPPRGASRGRVEHIHAYATETFNQVTTQGFTQVGVSSDLDAYADMAMGALAAGASLCESDTAGVLVNDGQFDLSQETEDELTFTFVAPTGGTPAGIADVNIAISWFY